MAGTRRSGSDLDLERGTGEPLPSYVATPASGRGRGVLVLHDASGPGDAARSACERLAREGFVALAPELGREDRETLAAPSGDDGAPSAALDADLDAAVHALLGLHAVEGPRIGVVGFGRGGHLALHAASRQRRIAAVVDFYGEPGSAVGAGSIGAAVLGIFAEKDEAVGAAEISALREELESAGVRATLRVQPGADRGFMDESRPDRHDAAAAAEAWRVALAFLRAELA